jgi:Tol biopolymer transport system component
MLAPGGRLGSYEVISPLGVGGMGEVVRAKDLKLGREVALKILPNQFASDPDRIARFRREAQVLASLNHPHIAAIYGLEEADGVRALVLELVEGQTLADRIARGRIPVDEALPIAKQIAEALEAAHEHSIIHRDLKPANIKIRDDGTVKVLDFGLAKLADPGSGAGQSDVTQSPTLSVAMSSMGSIIGTAAYMAPEQAAGKAVDKRADIWSFGVVLWEMMTGKRLFGGETISHTLADVLRAQVDFTQLPGTTPNAVRHLLQRCLQRDVRRRLRDIGEARIAIENVRESAGAVLTGQERARGRFPWMVSVLALTALSAALAYVAWRFLDRQVPVLRLLAPFPERASINPGSLPAVSPDGRHIAYSVSVGGRQAIWLRDLTETSDRLLPGAAGIHPFWSPDSRSIGFFAEGKLKTIDIHSGSVRELCDARNGRGGTWGRDNVILFAASPSSGLERVAADGGTPATVTRPDAAAGEVGHRFPSFLPDGRHFLYTAWAGAKTVAYVGALGSNIKVRLPDVTSNAVYADPGYLLFARENTLMALRYDARDLRASGEPIPIARGIDYFAAEREGMFSVSHGESGPPLLAYTSGWTEQVAQLTWVDRDGKPVGTVGPAAAIIRNPAISPNGEEAVAFERFDTQRGVYAVWIHHFKRGTDSLFTLNGRNNLYPVWSPNGAYLAYASDRDRIARTFIKSTTGVGDEMSLHTSSHGATAPDAWSREYLIETAFNNDRPVVRSDTNRDIWMVPLAGERKPIPYERTEFDEHDPRLSPNGGWIAYVSNETGQDEVFVQTFPTKTIKLQLSNDGGTLPVWSKDGRELYFISAQQMLMVVDATRAPHFAAAKDLFKTHSAAYDVSANGRFLLPTPTDRAFADPMAVVVNWPELLKKR